MNVDNHEDLTTNFGSIHAKRSCQYQACREPTSLLYVKKLKSLMSTIIYALGMMELMLKLCLKLMVKL